MKNIKVLLKAIVKVIIMMIPVSIFVSLIWLIKTYCPIVFIILFFIALGDVVYEVYKSEKDREE
ncbi:MAG: hypothetical protein IJH39_01215 [Clostridia bacterium]|nr:hypothetical protein [Clostridia bacterium]